MAEKNHTVYCPTCNENVTVQEVSDWKDRICPICGNTIPFTVGYSKRFSSSYRF